MAADRNEIVLGGCLISDTNPDRMCRNCGFAFLAGHRRSPIFLHDFWADPPAPNGSRDPEQVRQLLWMIGEAISRLDDLTLVADEKALDQALDPTVEDRWWWHSLRTLRTVCSAVCRSQALDHPETVPFSVWYLTDDERWEQRAGAGPEPQNPSVVHLSSRRDPTGMIAVRTADSVSVIAPPRHPTSAKPDPKLASWFILSVPHQTLGGYQSGSPVQPAIADPTHDCRVAVRIDGHDHPIGSYSFRAPLPVDSGIDVVVELPDHLHDLKGMDHAETFADQVAQLAYVGATKLVMRNSGLPGDLAGWRNALLTGAQHLYMQLQKKARINNE